MAEGVAQILYTLVQNMCLHCLEQDFLNCGSRPQMGSLSEILGSRDFNGLQHRVAVVQLLSGRTEWLWYVLLSFIKKLRKKEYLDQFLCKAKNKHSKLN